MAIFGFKRRKDEKLEQGAEAAKHASEKRSVSKSSKSAVTKLAKSSKSAAVKSAGMSGAGKSVLTKEVAATNISVPSLQSGSESSAASVIIRPRVTEKSGLLSQSGVYTFEVARNANKQAVSRAISALYKVTPIKVAMINTPIKNVFVKNRRGTVAGIRKAVVTVKKGDKIDFV